jgi:hypothetical protein
VEEWAGCSFTAQSLNIGLNSDDKSSSHSSAAILGK